MSLADEIDAFRELWFRGIKWETDMAHAMTSGMQRIESERQAVATDIARLCGAGGVADGTFEEPQLSAEPDFRGPWPGPNQFPPNQRFTQQVPSGPHPDPNGPDYGYQPPPPPPGYTPPQAPPMRTPESMRDILQRAEQSRRK